MFRRKGRLLLTVFALVISGVMFLMIMSLISSTNLTLDNEQARRGYDVRIGFTTEQPAETILPLVEAQEGVTMPSCGTAAMLPCCAQVNAWKILPVWVGS
jgi:putative ABC transport system permease protein